MNTPSNVESWERLQAIATGGDREELQDYVDEIGPSESFRALLRLDPEAREQVLTTLSPSDAADLFEEIPDEHAADLIEALPLAEAASIVSEMEAPEGADVLGDMETVDAERILSALPPDDAADIRALIRFADDTAGGLMFTDHLSFPETAAVNDVINALSERAESDNQEEDAYVYAVSASGRLVGVVDLRDLVLARRSSPVATILKSPQFVTVDANLDILDEFFDRYDFRAVPVVDKRQKLLGVVHRNDVAEALQERSDSDYLKMQGIIGGDEIRSLPLLTRTRRRLSWLSVNIGLNIIAASVIALYEDTLSAVIALAVFLPIVSDMSGCSGNQAVAVSMRELSLGIVKPYEIFRVWLKEVSVGLINGAVLGSLIATAAWMWKGNIYLGLVVGLALAANTVVAVSIGGTVPLILKRIGVDPAIASGPLLTTVTDMCGFFLVLSLATLMLPMLQTA